MCALVTGVQTCALPIACAWLAAPFHNSGAVPRLHEQHDCWEGSGLLEQCRASTAARRWLLPQRQRLGGRNRTTSLVQGPPFGTACEGADPYGGGIPIPPQPQIGRAHV